MCSACRDVLNWELNTGVEGARRGRHGEGQAGPAGAPPVFRDDGGSPQGKHGTFLMEHIHLGVSPTCQIVSPLSPG